MRLDLIQKPEPTAAKARLIFNRQTENLLSNHINKYNIWQDGVYSLADVFKEVVVDLRKRFHLLAELCCALE